MGPHGSRGVSSSWCRATSPPTPMTRTRSAGSPHVTGSTSPTPRYGACSSSPSPTSPSRAWIDDAAPHHVGYDIVTYVDVVPDELVPSLVDLLNQLAVDAPTGDIEFEAGAMTPEIYREQMQRRTATGRTIYETVAVKDGQVVAQSTMSAPPPGEEMPHLNQWGTYVHREHRGHRLGLAVKAANLRRRPAGPPGADAGQHDELTGQRADGGDQRADGLPPGRRHERVPAPPVIGRVGRRRMDVTGGHGSRLWRAALRTTPDHKVRVQAVTRSAAVPGAA